jgi:hypothetical protein
VGARLTDSAQYALLLVPARLGSVSIFEQIRSRAAVVRKTLIGYWTREVMLCMLGHRVVHGVV